MQGTTETKQVGSTTVEQIKLPTPPLISIIKPGAYDVTITKAEIVANHNGKPNIHLIGDTGTRLVSHNMFLTTPEARANAAKQIKNAFGVDLKEEQAKGNLANAIKSLAGRRANFRIEHEEYNGRMSVKVKFVNPEGSQELTADALNELSFDDAAPAEVSVKF